MVPPWPHLLQPTTTTTTTPPSPIPPPQPLHRYRHYPNLNTTATPPQHQPQNTITAILLPATTHHFHRHYTTNGIDKLKNIVLSYFSFFNKFGNSLFQPLRLPRWEKKRKDCVNKNARTTHIHTPKYTPTITRVWAPRTHPVCGTHTLVSVCGYVNGCGCKMID